MADITQAQFSLEESKPFPYGILEVKLAGDAPEWVNSLLAVGYLRRIDKFSKYQCAAYSFWPQKMRIQPFWFSACQPSAKAPPIHPLDRVLKTLGVTQAGTAAFNMSQIAASISGVRSS